MIIQLLCHLFQPPPPWMNTAMGNFNASELTPSESLVTSDDEDVKVTSLEFIESYQEKTCLKCLDEPRNEKKCILHMQKQRCRSAVQEP